MSDAAFADLLAFSHNFSRGVDDKGKALTAEENLIQMQGFLRKLAGMREACLLTLEQSARGTARLRGFFSEDLFALLKTNVESFELIVDLARNNGFLDQLRSTLPYSALNETWHALMRAVSQNLQIVVVARRGAQIMQAAMMIANPCRPWVWSIGCGAESTYESKIQQSTKIRMAALAAEEPGSVDAADEESDD